MSAIYALYRIEMDYGMPVFRLLQRANFDDVDLEICAELFAPTSISSDKKVIEVLLVTMGGLTTKDEALKTFEDLGLRPATLNELLYLAGSHPEIQLEDFVIALGSERTDDGKEMPYIGSSSSKGKDCKRVCGTTFFESGWGTSWSFACVKVA